MDDSASSRAHMGMAHVSIRVKGQSIIDCRITWKLIKIEDAPHEVDHFILYEVQSDSC